MEAVDGEGDLLEILRVQRGSVEGTEDIGQRLPIRPHGVGEPFGRICGAHYRVSSRSQALARLATHLMARTAATRIAPDLVDISSTPLLNQGKVNVTRTKKRSPRPGERARSCRAGTKGVPGHGWVDDPSQGSSTRRSDGRPVSRRLLSRSVFHNLRVRGRSRDESPLHSW